MEEHLKQKFINSFRDENVREVLNEKKHLLDKMEYPDEGDIHVNVSRYHGKDTWIFTLKDDSEIIIEE